MDKGALPRWHMLDDPDAVAVQAAKRILQSASRAIAQRKALSARLANHIEELNAEDD